MPSTASGSIMTRYALGLSLFIELGFKLVEHLFGGATLSAFPLFQTTADTSDCHLPQVVMLAGKANRILLERICVAFPMNHLDTLFRKILA